MSQQAVVEIPKPKKEKKRRRDYGSGRIYERGKTWWIQYYANGQQIRESSGSEKKQVAEEMLHQKMVDARTEPWPRRNKLMNNYGMPSMTTMKRKNSNPFSTAKMARATLALFPR